jgi:subtilisin family serine protease
VVVKFSDMTAGAVRSFIKSLGSSITRSFPATGLYEVAVPQATDIGSFIDTLNAHDRVVFAEPSFYAVSDAEFQVTVSTSEPTGPEGGTTPSSNQITWNLDKLELPAGWRETRGRSQVVVAVVDGMPEVSHEALAGKFATRVTDNLVFAEDRSVSSHATNICGIVAGESYRFTGVAPGVRLVPLVVNLGSQLYAERAAAIHFAAECARRRRIGRTPIARLVLSCSWRTAGDISVIRAALEDAVDAGVMVVCSAGNDNSSRPHYPSAYSDGPGRLADGVIAVAATDRNDRKAPYSNYSSAVDLAAPGGDGLPLDVRDVPCPEQGNQYGFAAGTSIAVPHVSAVVALMLSIEPGLSTAQLKRLVTSSSDTIDEQNPAYAGLLGAGRLNARKALAAVAPGRQPTQGETGDGGSGTSPSTATGSGPRVSIRVRSGPRIDIVRKLKG